MKLGPLTLQDNQKVIKSGGQRARIDVTMLTNTAILIRTLCKNRAQPKSRQKGEIFLMMR